jgi:hypothetical protein
LNSHIETTNSHLKQRIEKKTKYAPLLIETSNLGWVVAPPIVIIIDA